MTAQTPMHAISSPIIVALDYADATTALEMVTQYLDPTLCRLKVGNELFTAAGPKLVEQFQKLGFEVFLDLKYHDIPNTVAKAVHAAASLGVWMVNIHTSGGKKMMEAAAETLTRFSRAPHLIGVTVLTSFTETTWLETGQTRPLEDSIAYMAKLAAESGLDGVVCSAHEAGNIKSHTHERFITVTPGIRLAEDSTDDQARVMTPRAALEAGADYLVMGRSITRRTALATETMRKILEAS